jgi:hypothetical protein
MVDNQLDNLDNFTDPFGGEHEEWGLDGNNKPAEKPVAKADTFKAEERRAHLACRNRRLAGTRKEGG